ncbi:MAG: PAS domain S-box protein [Halioglobus sp.]
MKSTHLVIALLVFILGIAAAAAVTRYQVSQYQNQLSAEAEATTAAVSAAILAHLESRIHSLERMAKRLQRNHARNGAINFDVWRADALDYTNDQPGHLNLQVLNWQGKPLANAKPFENNFRALLNKSFAAQNTGGFVPGPERAAQAHSNGTLNLPDGNQMLAMAFPLFVGEQPIGYLTSFSDIEETISYVLKQKFGDKMDARVLENQRVVFQNAKWDFDTTPTVQIDNIAEFGGVAWSLQARDRTARTDQTMATQIRGVELILGALSLLCAVAAYLFLSNRLSLQRALESEKQLRETARFRDLVMEHTPDLIFVKDAEFRMQQLNPAMLELYGETPVEDILGKTTIEHYNEEEANAFLELDRLAFKEGRSETEESIVFPNGDEKTLLTTKVRFEDETGQQYILGVGRDITSLKHYEHELEQSEERYKLAFDGTSVGLLDWDCQTGDLFCSDRLIEILGLSGTDFGSRFDEFTELLHPDDRAFVLDAIRDHLTNRTPFRAEYRIAHNSGGYLWVHSRGQATWNETGEPTRMVGSIEDVTEKTLAQNELMRSYQELDDFAYIASHDLKEPLRGVNNHARFLEEDYKDTLGEDGKHRIERMLFLTQHMGRLIDDLLEYSRISREKADNNVVNLNSVVEEILNSYEEQDVEIVIARTLPAVECSEVQLSMIFRNLIANGLKYNESDKKRIVIDWREERVAASGSTAIYSVCDNGIGIDPRFHKEVFKIFKRLHDVSAYGGGTGSGLTLAKKIVEKYRGEIWIKNNEPQGTCFHFTLPQAIIVKPSG